MAVSQEDWLQAQYSVLGSVLIEPGLVPRVMAQTTERDYNGPCLTVYRAIRKLFLAGTAVDVVSLAGTLGPDYRNFLVQLMEITPTAANLDYYIALCREQSHVIALRDLAREMTEQSSMEPLRKLLEKANSLMVDRPSLKVTTMDDALRSFMDRHTRKVSYLTWPVKELDDRIYAEPGDFIIFGGSPSTGKSAWALQCAWHWARDHKVGFFSLETSSEKLFDRQMASVVQLSMDDIKRNRIQDDDWDRVASMTSDITRRNLELIPAAGMTPADVRAITMMRGYQIIFVDYLQLLQGAGENRTAQVTAISIALHTLAQSMGVTVVALSQLSRQGQSGEAPGMSALRESGQIEQDADVVMLLSLKNRNDPNGNRVLKIAKNKEGTCPNILLAFDGKHQTFSRAQTDTLSKLTAIGRKVKPTADISKAQPEQISMLPDSTPVPFEN